MQTNKRIAVSSNHFVSAGKRRIRLPLLAWLLLVPGAGSGEPAEPQPMPTCAEQVASRVQSHYQSIRDLEARFEQQTRSVTLGSSPLAASEASSGIVVFAKPGKMRWSYQRPEPSLVVSDGRVLWLYDPAAREAQRLPVERDYLSGAALQFLMGETKLLEEFSVSAEHCRADGEEPVDLELRPRQEASYERLGLRTMPETGEVVASTIVDILGNVTEIRFEGLRINLDPPDALFHFDVPPDVSVVDLAAPP
jgi:outer membrane lipoprotein carrier protein